MIKIGLDIGTGFVKCVSDHGSCRFPSLYVRRTHGDWAGEDTEAVGEQALRILNSTGTATVRPIVRGRPDPRYLKQVEMLIHEAVSKVRASAERANREKKVKIAVGLPYEATDCRGSISRMVKKIADAEQCTVVAQAVGTLIDLEKNTGMVVSVGQGTSEIVVIDDDKVIDGESSRWASEFITRKISKFAHLHEDILLERKETCRKYAKVLAENLATEVSDMAAGYGSTYDIALSGGGLLIPGVRKELASRLKKFKIMVPKDPVMSNAAGLYKLVE